MAKGGNQVISITPKDRERKSFKTAPSGTYFIRISKKSALKEMSGGTGANLQLTITKGPHKGINIFDNIAAHVTWKIGQLLAALGIKKNKFTMAELLKMVKDKELRAVVRVGRFEGKKRNEISQYLPLAAQPDEDDDEANEDEEELDDEDVQNPDDDEDDDEDDADDSDEEDDDDEDSDDDDNEDDDADDDGEDDDEDDADSDDDDSDDDGDEEDGEDDEDEDDESDDDDDEDEEDDEPPVTRRRAAAKKAPAKKAAAKKAPAKRGRRK